jgi:hypothetical protein
MSTKVRYCVGNVGHPRAAQYALRTLLEMVVPPSCLVLGPGVDAQREDEAVVTYGMVREGMESGVRVFDSGFFDHHYGSIDAMPKRPLARIQNTPAIYRDDRDATDRFYSFQHGAQGVTVDCHVDIVAGAFFLLSRYEETIVRTTDTFGRFPAESSVAYQEGFLQEPVVNQYAEQLLTMLRIAGFTGERRRWWRGAPWAIALTHDVDQQYRFPHGRPPALAVARSLAGRASADAPRWDRLLADYAATATHRKKDEYDCLAEMAAWEVSVGIRASYYFLGDSSGRRGADYATDAPGVTLQMKMVASMGHEIGFHAGFWAYDDTQCDRQAFPSSGGVSTTCGGRLPSRGVFGKQRGWPTTRVWDSAKQRASDAEHVSLSIPLTSRVIERCRFWSGRSCSWTQRTSHRGLKGRGSWMTYRRSVSDTVACWFCFGTTGIGAAYMLLPFASASGPCWNDVLLKV